MSDNEPTDATVEDIQEAMHAAFVNAGILHRNADAQSLALVNSIILDVLTKYVPLSSRGKALTTLLRILECMWKGDGVGFEEVVRGMDTTVLHFMHGWVSDMEIGGGLGEIIGLEYMRRHGMIQDYKARFMGDEVGVTVLPKMPVEFVKIDFAVEEKNEENRAVQPE